MKIFARSISVAAPSTCLTVLSWVMVPNNAFGADTVSPLRFQFSPATVAPGFTQVSPTNAYRKDLGFGFEPGAKVEALPRGGITAAVPFFFSVAVPEGNYQVTVALGDPAGESTTTVKAELRRLMLLGVHTMSGQMVTRSFTVNIRVPQISTGGAVRLKQGREDTLEAWAWDDKLTLEFNGQRPCLSSLEIEKADNLPTVFLLGDSTVCDQPTETYNSWGQMLTVFLTPSVVVANHAESGESLRSSLGAKRLDKVLSQMKPGDYLFIQYGHNDEKEKGDGVGAFTTYKADLKRFVEGAKAKGGIPVLITPVQRRTFDANGKITNSHGDYPEAVRQAAQEEGVALIDLHAMSTVLYEKLGRDQAPLAFAVAANGSRDGTHHNNYGSYELAKCIVMGIKQNKLDLARNIVADFRDFDPAHPDPIDAFPVPASPQRGNQAPLGN